MSKLNKSLVALALAGMALTAHAHKPWLLPTSTIVEGKEAWVTIDAAISEGLFDVDHQPLKIDTVVITGLLILKFHAANRPFTWPMVGLGILIPFVIALLFIH